MCGIAGIIAPDPVAGIRKMLASIEHRGRDNEGIWVSDPEDGTGMHIALGHRRLSVIDTSRSANQPFTSSDGRFRLTYNGEIYNYTEIREELKKHGYRFQTRSDTEVLLNSFIEWGPECLDRLNGMFAFAVWDSRRKELFLARDRAGIKPVFYYENGDNFVFASEIKAILASGRAARELDLEAFDQYLTFLWPVPPRTMFLGIKQLLPGHFLFWRDGETEIRQWWDLDFSVEDPGTKGEAHWIEKTGEALSNAVKMELVSDVPLGAFLSGGVDSSSIVSLMNSFSERPPCVYTSAISAKDLEFDIIPDDVVWARKVADLLSVDYHELAQTPALIDLLPKLIRQMDAPVVDMAIPSFLISEEARQTQKVMLSGMGGDEVFAGYPRHLALNLASRINAVPEFARRPVFRAFERMLPGGHKGRFTGLMRNAKKFARSAGGDLENAYLGFGTYFGDDLKKRVYSVEMLEECESYDAYSYHRKLFDQSSDWSLLNRLLYVDFKTFMPALNLDTVDRTSMAANLEVRVPFLNLELLNLGQEMPTRLKLRGLKRKYALKKYAESLLPKEIVWRKKAGFSAPLRAWLRGPLLPLVGDLLSEDRLKDRGFFCPDSVAAMIESNSRGREDFNHQIFQLLNIEIFMQEYFD